MSVAALRDFNPDHTGGSEEFGRNLAIGTGEYTDATTVMWVQNLRSAKGEIVALHVPLRLDVSVGPGDGCTMLYAPYARSSGAGRTLGEALADLSESVLVLRDELEGTPPARLAPDALEMKRRFANLLG